MMFLNVGILLLCLLAIILFKRVVADRTADFMQEFAPPTAGSGEGTGDAERLELSIDVAENLIHQAVGRASQSYRSTPF